MPVITVKTSMIKAVLLGAAKKDIRYYLNGLFLESKNGNCNLVGTDGHRMHVGHVGKHDNEFAVIISRESIESALKVYGKLEHLNIDIENKTIQDLPYKEIEGTFVNWRLVVPNIEENAASFPAMNPAYIADVMKAVQFLDKKVAVKPHFNECSLVYRVNTVMKDKFFAIIMAMRTDGDEDFNSGRVVSWIK